MKSTISTRTATETEVKSLLASDRTSATPDKMHLRA